MRGSDREDHLRMRLSTNLPGGLEAFLKKTGRRKVGRRTTMNDEARYVCDSCSEEVVVPIDLSAGSSQEYVEDCPVCCHPSLIHVEIDEDGEARAWAEPEQDYE